MTPEQPNHCQHMNFRAQANVNRLSQKEGGPITGYNADISIHCAECGVAFRFVGIPAGSSPFGPRVSVDATELRVPIEAAIVQEILGMPAVSGRA